MLARLGNVLDLNRAQVSSRCRRDVPLTSFIERDSCWIYAHSSYSVIASRDTHHFGTYALLFIGVKGLYSVGVVPPLEHPHTKSQLLSSITKKFYIYIIFNVFIFQLLLQSGIETTLDIVGDAGQVQGVMCIGLLPLATFRRAVTDIDWDNQGAYFIGLSSHNFSFS